MKKSTYPLQGLKQSKQMTKEIKCKKFYNPIHCGKCYKLIYKQAWLNVNEIKIVLNEMMTFTMGSKYKEFVMFYMREHIF